MAKPWILTFKTLIMKKIYYLFITACFLFAISSCWKEEIPQAGQSRRQVTDLTAVPGDEKVTLSWSLPEGWEPTDFLITYKNTESVDETIYTEGKTTYTILNLTNDFTYTFSVQAIYGELLSNVVNVNCKPTTTRIPITELSYTTDEDKEKKDQFIKLTWTKPSDLVESYTIYYYREGDKASMNEIQVAKHLTEYTITGITNEYNYVVSIVANYPKGESTAKEFKVRFVIPYFVSRTKAASGQPITYTFNLEKFPTATDIKWTFPDGQVLEGSKVTYGLSALGKQVVKLSADISGELAEWGIDITLREWVVNATDFELNGAKYTGFKGTYPVFSPDGETVYNITFNGTCALYAYDLETGEEKWRYVNPASTAGYNPPTVNPTNGDVYFGTSKANQFYCVSPEGELKWTFDQAGAMNSTAPAVSADGKTVYIIDANGNLFSLNSITGAQNWKVALGSKGCGILINGEELVVAISNAQKSIQFLKASDGQELASFDCLSKPTDLTAFAVTQDKKFAYFALGGGNNNVDASGLVKIDLVNRTKVAEKGFAPHNVYAPRVAMNGYVVAGCKDGSIYALDSDLTEVKWRVDHDGGLVNAFNFSHVVADKEGRVYITSGQKGNVTYTINAADGSIVDSFTYGTTDAQKQMGGNNFLDGVVYFNFIGASGDNGAFAGKYVGGERMFWGGPGGDICGSCCLQSPLL